MKKTLMILMAALFAAGISLGCAEPLDDPGAWE